jgi:hypothetical protein
MTHLYAIVPSCDEATTKGRDDYANPPDNRSVRYSLDGSKVLVEGLFLDDEVAWFEQVAVCIGDASQVIQHIADHRAEWETDAPN